MAMTGTTRPRLPRPIALALLATLGLHGGLWWLSRTAPDTPQAPQGRHATLSPLSRPAAPSWTVVRMAARPEPAWSVATRTAPTSPIGTPGQRKPDARILPDLTVAAAAPTPEQVPELVQPLPATADAPAPTPQTASSTADTATPPLVASRYYARDELDVAPSTTDTVLIAFPSGVDLSGHHVGRLQLFIDEAGVVQAVEFDDDGAPLPPPMQDAARDAFMKARFSPGQRLGVAARARLHIEVSFDEQPAGAMEAQSPAPATAPGATPGVTPLPQGSAPRA
jgi:hypothetical protein